MGPASTPAASTFAAPDYYHVHGSGITVTYTSSVPDRPARFSYQDRQTTRVFVGDQIRTVFDDDLGTIISVTLAESVDSGSVTFSLLLPEVNLMRQAGASATIHTQGITTAHRFSPVPAFNLGQEELYTVTPMRGTASLVILEG